MSGIPDNFMGVSFHGARAHIGMAQAEAMRNFAPGAEVTARPKLETIIERLDYLNGVATDLGNALARMADRLDGGVPEKPQDPKPPMLSESYMCRIDTLNNRMDELLGVIRAQVMRLESIL